MDIDFGRIAGPYARHRIGFPDVFFDRLAELGVGTPNQRVLDLGTGTGTLARGFARRGCDVTGLDPALPLLDAARTLDAEAGVRVTYVQATAEDTKLPDDTFQTVSAGQCWQWFDRERAMQELRRVIVPQGRAVLAHFDWIPLHANLAEATEGLISKYNPEWTMRGSIGMYGEWMRDLAEGGFTELQSFSFDVFVPYTHEGWVGRVRASAPVGASLSDDRIEALEAELQWMLAKQFDDPVGVHHRVFAAIGVSA